MTEYRHLPNCTGVCFSLTLQSMEEKESGISGHLYIFTFCEACDDASEMHFSGLHFYTILNTLIACRALLRFVKPPQSYRIPLMPFWLSADTMFCTICDQTAQNHQ